MKKYALVLMLFLCGCLDQKTATSSGDDSGSPFYYKKLNGSPITDPDSENLILECSSDVAGGFCQSKCISEIWPQYQRYSLVMSGYEGNSKCLVYIFAFQNGQTLPEMKYMVGNYTQQVVSGVTKGYCRGIDISTPDFSGRWAYSFQTNHDFLNWYDVASNLYKSIQLQGSGDIITYFDPDFNENVTVQTRPGYSCKKIEELTTTVIEGQEI